jgi:hypothetical protein
LDNNFCFAGSESFKIRSLAPSRNGFEANGSLGKIGKPVSEADGIGSEAEADLAASI